MTACARVARYRKAALVPYFNMPNLYMDKVAKQGIRVAPAIQRRLLLDAVVHSNATHLDEFGIVLSLLAWTAYNL